MYKNQSKLVATLLIWSAIAVPAFCFGIVLLGVLGSRPKVEDPVSVYALYIIMLIPCAFLIYMYFRRFGNVGFAQRVSNYFEKDSDGLVPVNEFATAMGMTQEQVVKKTNYLIRKGYLVNTNYDNAHRVFLLSDKYRPQSEFAVSRGLPEDKPFQGVTCPGCAAALKIRAETRGVCPYCGREIIGPSFKG